MEAEDIAYSAERVIYLHQLFSPNQTLYATDNYGAQRGAWSWLSCQKNIIVNNIRLNGVYLLYKNNVYRWKQETWSDSITFFTRSNPINYAVDFDNNKIKGSLIMATGNFWINEQRL